jgi:hypothetical protein
MEKLGVPGVEGLGVQGRKEFLKIFPLQGGTPESSNPSINGFS